MYASVVLQVSSSGKLLATVLLFADEGLLAVVSPHVNLQPLQHVETLPAALGAAPEHSVIPGSQDNQTNKQALVSPAHMFSLQQPTTRSDRATTNRLPTLMLTGVTQYKCTLLSQLCFSCLPTLSASTTTNQWETLTEL